MNLTDIQQLIESFIEHERLRGIRKPSVEIKQHLKPLVAFLWEQNLIVCEAGIKEIQEYQTWLTLLTKADGSLRYSPSTIVTYMSMGSCLFQYLQEQGIILANPFTRIKRIKQERSLPEHVPAEEPLQGLLEVFRTFWKQPNAYMKRRYYRFHVLAELLYASGLRIREALALKPADINFEDRTVFVREGKGGKARTAYLTGYAAQVVRFYLDEMRETVLVNNETDTVFGIRKLSTVSQTFHRALQEEGEKLGIGKLTSHSFRHALGFHLLKRGCDLRFIQLILGHEDMNTTTIYTKVTKNELKEKLDRFHPRSSAGRADRIAG